ncbi:MAG: SIMPL domain-containing protein [Bryobacteraceae bacterium]|nr:SIMPL domain-containing protein [Bryobacteraceae bacterium]
MMRFFLLSLLALSLPGQTTAASVRAGGEGVVAAQPDVVRISLTVSNMANTAQEAADQNATIVQAVTTRVRSLLGTNGETRTTSYSVSATYRSNPTGGNTLIGFTASNTLEATAFDINLAGRIIDAAVQAGATSVGGLRFGLRDSEPQRREALKRAAQAARVNAAAIAEGLNLRLGAVLAANESSTITSFNPADSRAGGFATATTFDTGLVEVRASVTLEVALQ